MALNTGNGLKHIFDVAMAPVLAFDNGDGGDIWSGQWGSVGGEEVYILPAPKAWTCGVRKRTRKPRMRRALRLTGAILEWIQ